MHRLAKFNQPPPNDVRALNAHFSGSYFSLRIGLAILAFAFPLVLYFSGTFFFSVELQPSLSAYFWAANASQCASFPLRSLFVGILVAIGAALYVYKGLTDLENWLLNLAAVCALVVALVPENLTVLNMDGGPPLPERLARLYAACPTVQTWATHQAEIAQASGGWTFPYHYVSAVTMFVCLFFVALLCAHKSLDYLPADAALSKMSLKAIYRWTAWSMLIFGAGVGGWLYVRRESPGNLILVLETGEIWIFSFFWWIKTLEMSMSKLEQDPQKAIANKAGSERQWESRVS